MSGAAAEDRLFGKYYVRRADGRDQPGGDKAAARYFVLDYVHDPRARVALRTYAMQARRDGLDGLADDLLAEYWRCMPDAELVPASPSAADDRT